MVLVAAGTVLVIGIAVGEGVGVGRVFTGFGRLCVTVSAGLAVLFDLLASEDGVWPCLNASSSLSGRPLNFTSCREDSAVFASSANALHRK